jgi:phenylalanyl-tRNA synthetase alpha chain
MSVHLSSEQLRRDLAVRDLTDPDQDPHAIQLLIDAAVQVGRLRGRCPHA